MLREGMFIADRYEILEKIGSGGMSDVYKAKCHKLNRLVAIKVLKPEFCEDKNFVSKFRVEAQSAAGLMHSNVVNVYDVGEENGIYYIIMELVEGITLKKYIEKKGHLGVREAVSVAIQVAQGIEAAHNHHIVHRDIKPQNIIISKEGKVKVTDFGIARAASSNTINSAVMGSVHYISPEQARGGYSDEKSDIYSFGITLFEMLTGRVPFEGDTTVAVALQHIQDDMVSPKTFLPELPISVEKIVLKCTQKKTDRRYQNMSELIADLKRSLVTPNEDFVIISSVIPNGATQMIGAGDMEEITRRASQKSADISIIDTNSREEQYEDYNSQEEYEEIDTSDSEEVEYSDDDFDNVVNDNSAKKIDKVITIIGITVGVILIAIVAFVIVKLVGSLTSDTTDKKHGVGSESRIDDGTIEVPSLVGYTYDEAKKKLNELGLGITKQEENAKEVAGTVIRQMTEAGTRVTPSTRIIVVVSLGAKESVVPDVVGKTMAEAITMLEEEGFVVKKENIIKEHSDDRSLAGLVKSTNPEAKTKLSVGEEIVLTVYEGDDTPVAKLPSVVGKKFTDAIKELNDAGFAFIEQEHVYSDSVEKDKVISQSGANAGETIDVSTTITIVISDGVEPPATIKVPEVIDKAKTSAESLLHESGFINYKFADEYNDTVASGNVIKIEGAKVGESVAANTEITLYISKGPKPTETETTPDETTPDETTSSETVAPDIHKLSVSVAADTITSAMNSVLPEGANIDDSTGIKIEYQVTYVDNNGAEQTVKLATSTSDTYSEMTGKAPYNVDSDLNAPTGPVTLVIDISFHNGSDLSVTTTVAAEIK